MAGLSGRVEWGGFMFRIKCGSCDLLLAALGPDFIRAHPLFSFVAFCVFRGSKV